MCQSRYKLPRELAEFKLLCPAQQKPALLAALLSELAPQGPTIVFAASVSTAHRWDRRGALGHYASGL